MRCEGFEADGGKLQVKSGNLSHILVRGTRDVTQYDTENEMERDWAWDWLERRE